MGYVYKGFSTVGKINPSFIVTDTELVKVDLMNSFNTRKGERVMMPTFGTTIQDSVMDPMDSFTKNNLIDEVEKVIASDPRVRLEGKPIITELDATVRIEVELFYVLQNTAETLYVDFKREIEENM